MYFTIPKENSIKTLSNFNKALGATDSSFIYYDRNNKERHGAMFNKKIGHKLLLKSLYKWNTDYYYCILLSTGCTVQYNNYYSYVLKNDTLYINYDFYPLFNTNLFIASKKTILEIFKSKNIRFKIITRPIEQKIYY